MDTSRHPSPETIEHFGSMPLFERRLVLRHVRSCRRCSVEAARVWRLTGTIATRRESTAGLNLQAVLTRVAEVEAALAWERERAPELLRELEAHPLPRRQTIVRNSRRFWLWGFAELLLAQASDGVFDDPQSALAVAELASDVANRLTESTYGKALVADFRAKAIKAVGNAKRVTSDLRGAEEAYSRAQELLLDGSGDPLEGAQLDYYWGTLRNAQRRFTDATRHFDRALAMYRRLGDSHEEARALIGKAIAVSKSDPEESIRIQHKALPLIDVAREPRLLLAAKHNLAIDLIDTGRAAEGLRILEELRPEYDRLGERMLSIRLRWVEAEAGQALGNGARAEEAYLEVISALESLNIPYDAAVASLGLATLYAEQGRTAEIKKLALEMLPVFQALDIQRETIAALMLFRQAAEAETASLALIQHIAGFLKRAQHDPALRFSPPS